LRKNQNQSPEEALDELEKIQKKADEAGLDVVSIFRWRSATLMATLECG